jgi:hypothetical protein
MAFTARHSLALGIILVAFTTVAGLFVFARPAYHANTRKAIHLPPGKPAADSAGSAGWFWPDGTPGWQAGERIDGFPVSGLQPVELDAARLAAARAGLDADGVRVLTSSRASTDGPLAILAAPTLDQTPVKTCLAAMLQGDGPIRWRCGLGEQRVLAAAARFTYPVDQDRHALYLVGVARGDVRRVLLVAPGLRQTLYTRGPTWGQFDFAVTIGDGARLEIFGRHGLVQTLPLDVEPGSQRIVG